MVVSPKGEIAAAWVPQTRCIQRQGSRVAWPGALDGISKCFSSTGGCSAEEVIRWATDRQESLDLGKDLGHHRVPGIDTAQFGAECRVERDDLDCHAVSPAHNFVRDISRDVEAINSSAMARCDTSAIAAWLADGARSAAQPERILSELCERLVACGVSLWRVAVYVRTLHPQIMGRRLIWRPGAEVEVAEAPFELLDTMYFRDSPIARVYRTGQAIRRKLADAGCPMDFPVLEELRAEGVTDYIATPLFFTDGAIHVATWTTRQPGGFSDAEIAGLERLIGPLARVTEIYALRRTASNLLDTYVGHSPGERILAGHIRRGDIEEIHAAIWLSDMRGFTALADRMPPRRLIDLLNRYFDCQVPAILDHRAEVLKFMGDGLLAIFPIADDNADADEVCCRTLAAACQVRTNVAELSEAIGTENLDALRFGLALHVGEVLYGNIGSGNRLDFTCIGPAVHLAARIEKLTGQLGRVILASGEFARHCPREFTAIGQFALAGFSAPQSVFGLDKSAQG